MRHVSLHNHEIAVCAASLVTYSIAVYGFNTGHFIDNDGRLPIQAVLAADVRPAPFFLPWNQVDLILGKSGQPFFGPCLVFKLGSF